MLATDFRDLPLRLLRLAARRQGLRLRTAQLDICDAAPLPPADLVVASDVAASWHGSHGARGALCRRDGGGYGQQGRRGLPPRERSEP